MVELDTIYNEDCLSTLSRMEDESVDLIITSPPYNKGLYSKRSKPGKWYKTIDYADYNDAMPANEYAELQSVVMRECMRVLKPTGSFFYNHKDILCNGLTIHPTRVYSFPIHEVIVWDRGSSCMVDPHYFQPITEYIYWIVKDHKQFYFNKAEAAQRTNVWRIPFEMNNPHPAPFPERLVANIVNTCSSTGGLVYDPYSGSCTTEVVAKKLHRHYVGSEISKTYIDYGLKRIQNVQPSLFWQIKTKGAIVPSSKE